MDIIDLKKVAPIGGPAFTRSALEATIKGAARVLKLGQKAPVNTKLVNPGTFAVAVSRLRRAKQIPQDVHVKIEDKENLFLARY